ncbi:MAG TPA: hypothetical protein VGT01_00440 [Candidatus Dormibacteraeota bacterium]|nr:hypothetical protein [Candidatus Dormibacteraeota bacterium]
MSQITRRRALFLFASAAGAAGLAGLTRMWPALADDRLEDAAVIDGRLVVTGIPGASAIAPIGTFLPGGPIHDKPELAAFTQPGRVLDPNRFLVASQSNFGAAKANFDQAAGSLLSVDPRGASVLRVPPEFASSGDQASVLGGAVQMYSAQSPNWRNGFYTPAAVTASQTGVSNPIGLSINNAFGRFWPANAPYGLDGPGTSTIDDPDGRPLKGAPNGRTGGVYFDDLTGRQPAQIIPGALSRAAVGTAFLGASPDDSKRAVFSVVVADGSIVQEHTAKALDGLAPAGTVAPLLGHSWNGDDEENGSPTPRLGAIVNYTPTKILYVSQPFDNSILAITLDVGGPAGNQLFVPTGTRVIRAPHLHQPVDLAPVNIETENTNWSSNTTMEEGSDFYVCNRGNGTIVRMRQDGSVVAVRRVRVHGGDLESARLNGIATSSDHSKIWVTFIGKADDSQEGDGGVVELASF